jgi:hypothetical protein
VKHDALKFQVDKLVELAEQSSQESGAADGLALILQGAYLHLLNRIGISNDRDVSENCTHKVSDSDLDELHSYLRVAYFHTSLNEIGQQIRNIKWSSDLSEKDVHGE